MEQNARNFVRTVLLVHLALLAVLIGIVTFAATRIYTSVRQQSVMQAQSTQELLARQVTFGLQSYYDSITRVLDLLLSVSAHGGGARTQARLPDDGAIAQLKANLGKGLWQQLEDRASMIVVVDSASLRVIQTYPADTTLDPAELIASAKPVIRKSDDPLLGPFTHFGGKAGHAIYVPLRLSEPRGLITFVPMEGVESGLLYDLNRQRGSDVMLLDEGGTIMSDPDRRFVGLSVFSDFRDARLRRLAADYMARGVIGTELFSAATDDDGKPLKPVMLTLAPVRVLNRTWYLVVSSGLAQVDGVVDRVFQEALLWAAFVVVSVTAILGSTAMQLIRVRVRLERVQREMMEKELNQARRIQLAWLPKASQQPRGVNIAAVNRPANHISGDFYNWFEIEDGRLVVVIGDVTGHGMSAAFLMSTAQLLVRTTMHRLPDPGAAMTEINRQLSAQMFAGQFVTMLILLIDQDSGTVRGASAGHPYPLVGRGGGLSPLPMESQLVLGVDESVVYTDEMFELPPEASMLLYTDGAIEVSDASDNQLGEAGLIDAIRGAAHSPAAIVDAVGTAVNRHRAGRPLEDDLTLVAVRLAPVAAAQPTGAGI